MTDIPHVNDAERKLFHEQLDRISAISTHVIIIGVNANVNAPAEIATTVPEELFSGVLIGIATHPTEDETTLHTTVFTENNDGN